MNRNARLWRKTGTPPGGLKGWICLAMSAAVGVALAASAAKGAGSFRDFMAKRGYKFVEVRRVHDSHLAVSGKLGGKKAQYLVDTGFSLSAVDERTAKRLKAVTGQEREGLIRTGANPALSYAHLGDFELGEHTFSNHIAMVVKMAGPIPRLRLSSSKSGGALDSDVILGTPFLLLNHAILDYGQSAGLFLRDKPRTQAEFDGMKESFEKSGFSATRVYMLRPPGAWVVEAKVNGKPLLLMLDSGSFRTIIDRKFAAQAGLRSRSTPDSIVGVGGREASMDVSPLDEFSIGEVTFRSPNLAVADLSAWNTASTNSLSPRGLLGADVLNLGRAVFDCEAGVLWMLKSAGR